LADQIGLSNTLRGQHDAAMATARAAASESACQAATEKGAAMSQAEAIAFALGESPPPTSPASLLNDQGCPHLTCREQEVAALIAQGMTNSEIAAVLVISARTVETHVQHIMNKLGCGTRAQIAAWVASGPASRPSAVNR
jgi:DNA-binding NarL/FixJ family response regulator